MNLYYNSGSDPGCMRSNNEDYHYTGHFKNGIDLFVVADGMGGHHGGEVASRKAVSWLVTAIETWTGPIDSEQLNRLIHEINRHMLKENHQRGEARYMGTTLSALLIQQESVYIAHVGDSRIYRFRPSGPLTGQSRNLSALTEDHSFVAALLKAGSISEAEASRHPKRHVLNQSVGMRMEIEPQITGPLPLLPGDKFLLCSDGLTGVVPEAFIQEIMALSSNSQIVSKLIKKAKENGGPDNISVISLSTTPPPPALNHDQTRPDGQGSVPAPGSAGFRRQKLGLRRTLLLLSLLSMLLLAVIFLLVTNHETTDQKALVNNPEISSTPAVENQNHGR